MFERFRLAEVWGNMALKREKCYFSVNLLRRPIVKFSTQTIPKELLQFIIILFRRHIHLLVFVNSSVSLPSRRIFLSALFSNMIFIIILCPWHHHHHYSANLYKMQILTPLGLLSDGLRFVCKIVEPHQDVCSSAQHQKVYDEGGKISKNMDI